MHLWVVLTFLVSYCNVSSWRSYVFVQCVVQPESSRNGRAWA